MTNTNKFIAWLKLSRAPFLSVGILPFILGALLYKKIYGDFNILIFLLSCAAVVFIMLSTYLNGEYYDTDEDVLSDKLNKRNKFSGGSGIPVKGIIQKKHIRTVSYISITSAICIGLLLQFYFKTGIWTIPLGVSGIIFGFFYSKPPLRWVKRGYGEILIGYCYGWLPIAVSFYLQSGFLISIIFWISIPIGLSIINVIFLNEFPDYEPDKIAGKTNILVRIGKKWGAHLYAFISILQHFFVIISIIKGFPKEILFFYTPFFIISIFLIIMILKGKNYNKKQLEFICGLNIIVNLGTTLSYILSLHYLTF